MNCNELTLSLNHFDQIQFHSIKQYHLKLPYLPSEFEHLYQLVFQDFELMNRK